MDEERVKKLVADRISREGWQEDPYFSEYLDGLEEELSKDEYQTIMFLRGCTDKELYHIATIFEDIAFKFQSKSFIDLLKKLAEDHPAASMDSDIEDAERTLDDEI